MILNFLSLSCYALTSFGLTRYNLGNCIIYDITDRYVKNTSIFLLLKNFLGMSSYLQFPCLLSTSTDYAYNAVSDTCSVNGIYIANKKIKSGNRLYRYTQFIPLCRYHYFLLRLSIASLNNI